MAKYPTFTYLNFNDFGWSVEKGVINSFAAKNRRHRYRYSSKNFRAPSARSSPFLPPKFLPTAARGTPPGPPTRSAQYEIASLAL